jgi:dTDP-4-dehydrorhamnose 3,5-epimerase
MMNTRDRVPTQDELTPAQGLLPGAARDRQSITRDWETRQELIDGVIVKEVRNVAKDNGYLTELWRADWGLPGTTIAQVFQASIEIGGISAWHVHQHATDRLFANLGFLKIVLYDARAGSRTKGRVNVLRCGMTRPMLVVVPPGVWHGVQNVGSTAALLMNMPDRAYQYESPDHWRLPHDTTEIPYSFSRDARPNSEDPGRI